MKRREKSAPSSSASRLAPAAVVRELERRRLAMDAFNLKLKALLDARVRAARAVIAWKWSVGLKLRDAERERAMIAALARDADGRRGLDAAESARVFRSIFAATRSAVSRVRGRGDGRAS